MISLDNTSKKNAITPALDVATVQAPDDASMTTTTSGSRSWIRPASTRPPAWTCRSSSAPTATAEADPEGSGRPVRPPQAHHQAGDLRRPRHHLHRRDRDDAGGRHRHRGGHRTLLSARVEARDRAARRCALPLLDTYGLGQRDVPPLPLRRVRRGRGLAHRLRARGSSVRQAPRARDGDRPSDLQMRTPRSARDEGRGARLPR